MYGLVDLGIPRWSYQFGVMVPSSDYGTGVFRPGGLLLLVGNGLEAHHELWQAIAQPTRRLLLEHRR